jgi:hypothetical protein
MAAMAAILDLVSENGVRCESRFGPIKVRFQQK